MNQEIAKLIYKYSLDRQKKGEVPLMLGIDGILALIWDKIRRYRGSLDRDEVLDIASDAMFAASIVIESIATQHEPEPSEENLEDSNEYSGLPDEFIGWESDPLKAQNFLDYIREHDISVAEKDLTRIVEASKQ